jgi:hypothetical protein
MRLRRAVSLLAAAALAVATARPTAMAGEDLPPRNQALLLLRVLAYDRNLKQRAGAAVTVAVLYKPGDRSSEAHGASLVAAFEEVSRDVVVAGLPVRVEAMPYRDAADFEARLGAVRPALAYVDLALGRTVPDILQATRRRGVLTAAGSRSLVEAGLAIGVEAQSGRAGLIVNLKASRLEGADLDAALLAVSDVVKD